MEQTMEVPEDVVVQPALNDRVARPIPAKVVSGIAKSKVTRYIPNTEKAAFKAIVIGIALLGIGAITAVLIAYSFSYNVAETACRSIEKQRKNNGIVSPIEVNLCNKVSCTFDTAQCSQKCPFGYNLDENLRCEINCKCATKGLLEGDISFSEDSLPDIFERYIGARNADLQFSIDSSKLKSKNKWPLGSDGRIKVPYLIDKKRAIDVDALKTINGTIAWLSKYTCADLIPAVDTERHYVEIKEGSGRCSSSVGKSKDRLVDQTTIRTAQDLFFSQDCISLSGFLHLFMHLLGFYHEFSREDRDSFINVDYEYLLQEDAISFVHSVHSSELELEFDYDLHSILQPTSDVGAIQGSYWFVKKSDGQLHLERAKFLSDIDIAKIRKLYKCTPSESATDGEWTEWGKWSGCSKVCDNGTMKRYRECLNSAKTYVGTCKGKAYESNLCNKSPCMTNLGSWVNWGPCSRSCGTYGVKIRTRSCVGKTVLHRRTCKESLAWTFEKQPCTPETDCPTVDADTDIRPAQWNEWSQWERCPKRESCEGNRLTTRIRTCLDGAFLISPYCKSAGNETKSSGDKKKNYQQGKDVQVKTCECLDDVSFDDDDDVGLFYEYDSSSDDDSTATSKLIFDKDVTEAELLLCDFNTESWHFSYWLIGEYDGKIGPDVLCINDQNGLYRLGYARRGIVIELSHKGRFSYCGKPYLGDFDGDGRSDVLCVDSKSNEMSIYPSKNGKFEDEHPIVVDPFCMDLTSKLYVMDLNGDGKSDLLCFTLNKKLQTRLTVLTGSLHVG